jgi:hypothetical protein
LILLIIGKGLYLFKFLFFFLDQKEPKNQEKTKLPPAEPNTRPAVFSGQRSFDSISKIVSQFELNSHLSPSIELSILKTMKIRDAPF